LWGTEAAKDSIPATPDDNLPQIASFQLDRQLPAVRLQPRRSNCRFRADVNALNARNEVKSMKRIIFAAFAIFATSQAFAQAYYDYAGKLVEGTVSIPYSNIPASPGQHNLPLTSPTGLTIPPGGARFANVCASAGNIVYTTDGTTTPAGGIGQPLALGRCIALSGPQVLANFRAIASSGTPTATLDVEYFR
jgi:hypothetical protein